MTSSMDNSLDCGSVDRLTRSPDSPRTCSSSSPSLYDFHNPPLAGPTHPAATEFIRSPKQKSPTPLERFWKHARTSRTPDGFPPPTWFEPEKNTASTDNVTIYKNDEPLINEAEAPEASSSSAATTVIEESKGESPSQTLAQRIQAMMSPVLPENDANIQSRTPSSALSPLVNSKFMSLLSSPKMMNGSPMRFDQSVWSILDRLQSPVQDHMPELGPHEDNISNFAAQNTNGDDFREYGEDGSSMMLCSPLIPQRDSLVELADTEYVSLNEFGQILAQNHRSPLCQEHTIPEEHELQDPDQASETEPEFEVQPQPEEPCPVNEEDQVEDQRPVEPRSKGFQFQWPWSKSEEKKSNDKPKEKRVWIPSTTKISLQTAWWGYRM
jgi:hypothetical protein